MKIAVIGAGLAGVTAACELQARGHEVEIVEKSRGMGGRLATKRLDWGEADIGAQYFTVRNADFSRAVARWQAAGVVAPWHFTPHKVVDGQLVPSPDETARYVALPGMNALAKADAGALSIRFQCRIVQVTGSPGAWLLQDDKGDRLGPYHWVILSLPAAQSQALLLSHPHAALLAEQIPAESLQPCWALLLATRGCVDPGVAGIFGDETVSWVSRLNHKPGRQAPADCDDLWLLHFGVRWSAVRGKEFAPQLPQVGSAWLQQHLATPLQVHHSHAHFWRYAKLRHSALSSGPLVEQALQLAVIGDWTRGGRIEGAYLSALAMVQQQFD